MALSAALFARATVVVELVEIASTVGALDGRVMGVTGSLLPRVQLLHVLDLGKPVLWRVQEQVFLQREHRVKVLGQDARGLRLTLDLRRGKI